MAAEIRRYNYTGAEGEVIPDDATHVTVDESVRVIRRRAFLGNCNIVEVIFGPNVEKVEEYAFAGCSSLRRVIMPGVEIVEMGAFIDCWAMTEVECGKLENIGHQAFYLCPFGSIDLPSAKIVEYGAFHCFVKEVTFSNKLESIKRAFVNCRSLERITIPLKDGMIHRFTFQGCENLKHVDLVEGPIHETIAALHLEEWRNDMNEEINSINQILPTVSAGYYDDFGGWRSDGNGEIANAIGMWIRSVLRKIMRYTAKHQRLLDEEVATTLQLKLALPQDIVINNIFPFLELPAYTFEEEEEEQYCFDLFDDGGEDY